MSYEGTTIERLCRDSELERLPATGLETRVLDAIHEESPVDVPHGSVAPILRLSRARRPLAFEVDQRALWRGWCGDVLERLLAVGGVVVLNGSWKNGVSLGLAMNQIGEGRRPGGEHHPGLLFVWHIPTFDIKTAGAEGFQQMADGWLRRIDHSLGDDPAAAIGSSKQLVESVCRIILADYGEHPPKGTDLPDLYKQTAKKLRLAAEDIPDSTKGSKAAQMTLRTLATTIQSLAELRNELGTGHGRLVSSPAFVRHGRLAFRTTVTVSDFLLATWHERRNASTS